MLSSARVKWIIAVIVLITTVGMVQKTLNDIIYLPVVMVQATQTFTPTPTATATQTPTSTPTPDGVRIVEIFNSISDDPLDEFVRIYNYKSNSINLTGWFIRDDGLNLFDFPANFYIGGRQTVRIWTTGGGNTNTDLYWNNDTEVWNDFEDCAYLRDDSEGDKLLIDIFCYVKDNNGILVVTRMP